MSLPPPLPNAMLPGLRADADLRTLASLYAAMAALQGTALLLLAAFLAFGIHFEATKNAAGQPAAKADSGQGVIVMLAVLLAVGLVVFNANVIAALCLRRRRRLVLCRAGAALAALAFPFGTVLSLWTLLVLHRPSAIALFRNSAR